VSEFKRHPLSAAFASMADTDLGALIADIEQFGQRESGLLLNGMVLDGWHRYQATRALGIEFNYLNFEHEFPDTDPVCFVISKNLHRRHLTKEQRAAAVVACRQWASAGNPNLATVARLPTNRDLAQEADVSERTISRAKVAHEAGLSGAVIAGEMTLRQAEEAAKAHRASTIREQKPPAAHEGALELAARTDAVAAKPSSRVRAVEESSAQQRTLMESVISERDELREQLSDVATAARELEAEVEAYRASERGEGEKHLVEANKRIAKLEGEVRRLEIIRDGLMNDNAELKKQIKSLQRKLGNAHA